MKRKDKIYELIGRAVVYSACYVGSVVFFYWGFLQRINILGGKKMETARPRGTDKAEVVQVIKTTSILGRGIEKDPVRHLYQYWDFKGNLLASHDTLSEDEVIFSP